MPDPRADALRAVAEALAQVADSFDDEGSIDKAQGNVNTLAKKISTKYPGGMTQKIGHRPRSDDTSLQDPLKLVSHKLTESQVERLPLACEQYGIKQAKLFRGLVEILLSPRLVEFCAATGTDPIDFASAAVKSWLDTHAEQPI